MKIAALWIAAALSAASLWARPCIVHGIGSWWILIAAVATFAVSSATLWGEVRPMILIGHLWQIGVWAYC
ncbi:hypothetical protein GS928_23460 [Rhodococcus hoagii]|nr:hypothetical protein [Prescottella equi]